MREKEFYKLQIASQTYLKEIELSPEKDSVIIGMNPECDVRLRRELFFVPFSIEVYENEGEWFAQTSENVYFSVSGTDKAAFIRLFHGQTAELKDAETDNTLATVSCQMDFDRVVRPFTARIDVGQKEKLSIGTANYHPDIEIKSDYSTDERIVLQRTRRYQYRVISANTKFDLLLNGKKIHAGAEVHETDYLQLAEFRFYFSADGVYTDQPLKVASTSLFIDNVSESRSALQYPQFNRTTRMKVEIPSSAIKVLDPPQEPVKPKNNIIVQLLPVLAMVALVVLMRMMMPASNMSFLLFSIVSMSIGGVTSIASFFNSKKEFREDIEERKEKYGRYINDKEQEIQDRRSAERTALENVFYDVSTELEIIRRFDGRLFDRDKNDDDFLTVRVGTGRIFSREQIDCRVQEKISVTDELALLPAKMRDKYAYVENAPVTMSLKGDNGVGIIGDADEVYEALKVIILDLCTRQYFDDLEMILLISPEDVQKYSWARWLPHFRNDQLNVRNIVYSEESRQVIFEYLLARLSHRAGLKPEAIGSHMVIIVDDMWNIENHPISRFFANASELKAHFIFCVPARELLPSGCNEVLYLGENHKGRLTSSENSFENTEAPMQTVSDQEISEAARKLAPVYCAEVGLESSLTKNISLFELLKIYSGNDLDYGKIWEQSDVVKSMAAPIGVMRNNEVLFLDIHEKADGPHGLVAGTTGSGKSELLQTYILSVAAHFHPYEVSFVIIDFKGGGMANQFENLPHLIGTITNIDGKEINRSLLSIKAELEKRQKLFAEAQVNNINSYIKLYKAHSVKVPLPHLIIIVDEFAELKADQPEFMKELISASRIGRSLGVHLILATQKPSGQVSEQIWSNSRFRLCLKVQTEQDSQEVLKSPLAAEIKEPGRAYLQVGNNEKFELFQSAYSGATVADSFVDETKAFSVSRIAAGGVRNVVYKTRKKQKSQNDETQLKALTDSIRKYCEDHHIAKLPPICLPPLKECIQFETGNAAADLVNFHIPMGIYDDPKSQYQGPMEVDLSTTNLLVIGSVQMGKTNIVQNIIRFTAENFSPDQVSMYILDFASMTLKVFEKMCHVGGVVIPGENEKLKNLFKLLRDSVTVRKDKLISAGVSSYSAYAEAGFHDLPRILVFLENFAVFKELYEDSYESEFQSLTREGPTYGIHFIVTNVKTQGLGFRYMSNFGERIALTCNERDEYSAVFDRCRLEPEAVPGRALCKQDTAIYEMQSYLAFEGEKEVERSASIRKFISEVNQKYPGQSARPIPEVPEFLRLENMLHDFPFARKKYVYPIGLDYSSVDIVPLDLNRYVEFSIIAAEESQRDRVTRSILQVIRYYAVEDPVRVCIIDDYDRKLKEWDQSGFADKYTIDAGYAEEMLSECEDITDQRLEMLRDEDMTALENEPMMIYILRNPAVLDTISSDRKMLEQYQNICRNARNLKVFFLFAGIEDAGVSYNAPALLKRIKENRQAVVADKLDDVKVFDVPLPTVREYRGHHIDGDCYLFNGNEISRIRMAE